MLSGFQPRIRPGSIEARKAARLDARLSRAWPACAAARLRAPGREGVRVREHTASRGDAHVGGTGEIAYKTLRAAHREKAAEDLEAPSVCPRGGVTGALAAARMSFSPAQVLQRFRDRR